MNKESSDDPFAEFDEVGRDRSLDEVLELLSNRYVRYVLYALSDRSTATLDDLSEVVAGVEATETESVVSEQDLTRIRNLLYHMVLPELDHFGYVRFDAGEQTVEASVPPDVYALLDAIG